MNELYIFIFTIIASTEGFIVASLLIYTYLFRKRCKREAVLFGSTTILLMLLVKGLKHLFQVPRPPEPLIEITGYGLPSGHAAGSIFLALTIIYLTRNMRESLRYSIWFIVLLAALLIGVSRVQLGVHTIYQVIAGYLLGILCVYVFIFLRKKFLKNKV